jgi:hypothetical protein
MLNPMVANLFRLPDLGSDRSIHRVNGGQRYWIQVVRRKPTFVDPEWNIVFNQFQFEWRFDATPGNDSFATPFALPSGSSTLEGESFGATSEPGDVLNRMYEGPTLWWTWTAASDGRLSVTSSNRYLKVYRGSTLGVLQEVTGDEFHAVATVRQNETLRVCLYHYSHQLDKYALWLEFTPRAAAEMGALPLDPDAADQNPVRAAANAWRLQINQQGDEVELLAEGEPGKRAVIESSEDLVHWQALTLESISASPGGAPPRAMVTADKPQRHFRVRVVD